MISIYFSLKIRISAQCISSNEQIRIVFSGEFEGDIVNVNKDEMDVLTRNAIKSQRKLWPNCKVPYVISSSYSSYERSVIASAMSEYHEKTCIKYVYVLVLFIVIVLYLVKINK